MSGSSMAGGPAKTLLLNAVPALFIRSASGVNTCLVTCTHVV